MKKQGNACGAKWPYCYHVVILEEEVCLMNRNQSTTDRKWIELPQVYTLNQQNLPEKVFKLRKQLYIKAKQEPVYRFYALYDRLYRQDVLTAAWAQVFKNDGAPGVDSVAIKEIVRTPETVERFLKEIQEELKTKSYKPRAVKRRSQRPYRPPAGVSWYKHLHGNLGLIML